MQRKETVTFLSARTFWLVTLEICTGLRCSLAPSNDNFYWSLAVLLIFQMISCVNLGKLYPPWYKHNIYQCIMMYVYIYIHIFSLCYFFCTKNVEFINTFSICQAGWKRNLSCCLFPCWQCHPVVDPHCRLCQWRTRPWESWRRYRRKRIGFCRRAVTETTSCMILIFWWILFLATPMTLAVDPSQGGNGLKSIQPPRISSISMSSLSKQLPFSPQQYFWVYRMVTRMLNPRGVIWGSSQPASHLEAAMVARACEDLEPLRVAIEKAREVWGFSLWRWVVGDLEVNGIGQHGPKQEYFI